MSVVKNHLSVSKKIVLNNSLNFTIIISQVPYLNMISPTGEIALTIPKAHADRLRWEMRTLEKPNLPTLQEGKVDHQNPT